MNRTFNHYPISQQMNEIIGRLGFKKPTEIQHEVIPQAFQKRNIIGQSQTGTGKTHAYLIPMFDQIDSEQETVQKLIIAPTRELAMQIYEEIKKMIEYGNEMNWTARLVIGGTDKNRELQKMKTQPHIVVGTPGRILDFMKEQAIRTADIDSVVLDEADLTIDLGLIHEVDQILYRLKEDIQISVFSATIPTSLKPFLKKYLSNPLHIEIDQESLSPEKLEHRLIPLRHRNEADLLIEASKLIHPYIALVFVNKKENADELANELLSKGFEVGVIHGGLKPRERKRTLQDLKSLRFQYIVATDLAARGIDIPGVSHVFNAQLPQDIDAYIHRVGRTARAGLEGTAVSFYADRDIPLIEKLEERGMSFTNMDIKNGEWVEVKEWNERKKRQRKESELDAQAWKQVRKRKKVKPGYKKKMKSEKDQIKKRLKKEQFRNKRR